MDTKAVKLGINIDHVATLRQARGTSYPELADAALLCEQAGAHGITVHLREDRRHIQDKDVYAVKKAIGIPLNLEMANSPEIVEIALDLCPAEACIVPEKRQELTTEGGLDVLGDKARGRGSAVNLEETLEALMNKGVEVSLFIDPEPEQIEASAGLGVPYIELHTGTFCDAAGEDAESELGRLVRGAELAHGLGLKVNAGHGINLSNVRDILKIPHLDTLNIGHSIIARSVFVGIEEAVREMLSAMRVKQ